MLGRLCDQRTDRTGRLTTWGTTMAATDTAQAIAAPMGDLGGRFMLSARTYATGAEYGFSGLDFYFCGRGGVLGAVDASVVIDELAFFEPGDARRQWEAGLAVMPPAEAAARFIECGYAWGRARLPQSLPAARLADLSQRVMDASAATLGEDRPALFAAWSDRSWPEDERARALHAVHLWRELRGGLHVQALRRVGLDPRTAVMITSGDKGAEFFGWSPPHPDPEPFRELWATAEAHTNDAVALCVGVLDDAEQAELIALTLAAAPPSR